MRMNRLAWPSAARAKTLMYYLLVVGAPSSIFLWHLRSQTIGLGPAESAMRSAAKLSNLKSDSLNLPYKLLENGLYHSGLSHVLAMRLGSVIVGMMAVAAFFYVLRGWFGKPIALLSVLLFALTPLYLLASRIADGTVMFVSPLFLLLAYYLWGHLKRKLLAYGLIVLALCICLYTPGVIWILLPALIYWREKFTALLSGLGKRHRALLGLLTLILLLPLIHSLLSAALLRSWLLLPVQLPSLAQFAKGFAWGISDLLVHARPGAELNVGNVPILDAVQIGLLVFGVYVSWSRLRSVLYWMGTSTFLVLIVTALNPRQEQLLLILPFIAFLCGMGLRYLFLEWRQIFPKNPLAKGFAITLMSAIVFAHLLYGIRYSLLAWPATPHISHTYVIK